MVVHETRKNEGGKRQQQQQRPTTTNDAKKAVANKKEVENERGQKRTQPQSVLDMQTRNIQIMKYERWARERISWLNSFTLISQNKAKKRFDGEKK